MIWCPYFLYFKAKIYFKIKPMTFPHVFFKAVWDWDMKRTSALPKKSRHSTLKVRNIWFFFSSRSLKTNQNERKNISFAQFVYFLSQMCLLLNFWMMKLKSKHTSVKKIYKLRKSNIFFSHFEWTRGENPPNISHLEPIWSWRP